MSVLSIITMCIMSICAVDSACGSWQSSCSSNKKGKARLVPWPTITSYAGYPTFKGQVFDGQHLQSILDGLEANGLLQGYTHLLTGLRARQHMKA